ncbi:MAG: sialidase family protein [Candidatus Binatia bacterium]
MGIGPVAVLALTAAAFAQPSYEIDVSNDPAVKDGEPSLAVNPTNPRNLVIGHMKETGRDLGEIGRCAVATSFDQGLTWQSRLLPLTDAFYGVCADPTVIFAADGTAYMAAIAFNLTFQTGHTVVTRSSDGGITWTPPVEAVGPTSLPSLLRDGVETDVDPFDRPWLAFDEKTGTLYLTTMTIFSRPMGPLSHRYLTASRDWGETWGNLSVVDSADYPADDFAIGTIAVGPDGTVAIAYAARSVPEPGFTCPCVVLATTTDGATFSHHTVPFTDVMFGVNLPDQGDPPVLRFLYGPVVAADPTRPGRYAVSVAGWKGLLPFALGQFRVVPQSRVQVQLFLTDDGGASWTAPAPLGEDLARDREHVWIDYSPAGALGVTWRTHVGPCCFGSTEVWSVVSRDGGTTFDPPRKVSHAPSPFTEGLGDDFQSVVLDGSTVHAAWGDKRSGEVEVYYGRLSIPPVD